MAPRSGNQRCDESHQVVVHLGGPPERRGGCRHDSRHEVVRLRKGRLGLLQLVCADTVESLIVDNNHCISLVGEAVERQNGVVGLHHYVRRINPVRKH